MPSAFIYSTLLHVLRRLLSYYLQYVYVITDRPLKEISLRLDFFRHSLHRPISRISPLRECLHRHFLRGNGMLLLRAVSEDATPVDRSKATSQAAIPVVQLQ